MKRYATLKRLGLCTVLFVSALFCHFFLSFSAHAQPYVPSSSSGGGASSQQSACDGEFRNALGHRAWLEAQREITQNQNLIFKPDSVLEYTCFNQFANVIAEQALHIFSESRGGERWGAVSAAGNTPLHATRMDETLTEVVGQPMSAYLQNSYEHDLLGGRASMNYDEGQASPVKIQGGSYTCDMMQRVWQEAKCWDFIKETMTDGFYGFDRYLEWADSGADLRLLPRQCGAAPWRENYDPVYENEVWKNMEGGQRFDAIVEETHRDVRERLEDCRSNYVVPTGVRVRSRTGERDDGVCVAPGCSLNQGGQCG